jgi:DNA-binding PadR family transcriptional regulator
MENKPPRSIGLSPEFVVLGLLSQQPAHGYELERRISSELGEIWHISLSQIYNILHRLEDQGYISGEQYTQDKLPERRNYQLTEVGSERFFTWLNNTSGWSVKTIRVEFTTRLFFAQMINSGLAHQIIDEQIMEIERGLSILNQKFIDIPAEQIFNRLGMDLRLRQMQSILTWLNDCHQVIFDMDNH